MYVCSLVKWPQGELLFITYMENFHMLVKKKELSWCMKPSTWYSLALPIKASSIEENVFPWIR